MSAELAPLAFEGNTLSVVTREGATYFVAAEVSRALGYTEPGRITDLISKEWKGEFIEGVDFVKLTGPDLRALRVSLGDDPRVTWVVGDRVNSLLLLTRDGLNLALIKTRKPAGVRMRRWLVSEVLPALAARRAPPVTPALPAPADELLARLERLAAELESPALSVTCVQIRVHGWAPATQRATWQRELFADLASLAVRLARRSLDASEPRDVRRASKQSALSATALLRGLIIEHGGGDEAL